MFFTQYNTFCYLWMNNSKSRFYSSYWLNNFDPWSSALATYSNFPFLCILFQLFRHPKYVSCKRIAVFLNMSDEVHTEEILKDIFKQGKTCFIPRYKSSSSNHMDMLQLSSLEDLETLPLTSWNIRQPAEDDNSREEALFGGKHVHISLSTI